MLHIVDDFYEEPFVLRDRYLSHAADFVRNEGARYPGLTFDGLADVREETIGRLAVLLDRPLSLRKHAVRVATAADYERDDFRYTVHLDFTPYTAIVYLGLVDPAEPHAEHPEYGTFLYEHRETEQRRVWYPRDPEYPAHLAETGLTAEGYEEQKRRIASDFFDASRWRVYERIPYRFNRVVVHDACRWYHSGPDRSFGEDLKSGRMTANYFLNFDIRGLFA